MVYGNANFLGIPWETIVKSYREKNGRRSLPRIRDHAKNFFRFMSSNKDIFPESAQERYALLLCGLLWHDLRKQMEERMSSVAKKERRELSDQDVASICEQALVSRVKEVKEHTVLPGFSGKVLAAIRKQMAPSLHELFKKIYGTTPLNAYTKRTLLSLQVQMLSRAYFGPFHSGVVVAGFGNRDFLPALVSHDLEAMVGSRIRCSPPKESAVTDDNDAMVCPFAQQDMVYSFMEGVDKNLMNFIETSTSTLFMGSLGKMQKVLAALDGKIAEEMDALKPTFDGLLRDLFGEWKDWRAKFWGPVVNNIASLPKDELAATAEAFVNLTKFRRRVTTERETVGGPVDVAVITKGDGFVWVKRKHYFDPAKNPRILAKLNRGDR